MTGEELTKRELFRGGIAMLVFCVMYALVLVEIAVSFSINPGGPILLLLKTRFPSSDLAGYYMVMILDVLMMVGAGLCYCGIKWVRGGMK